MTLKANFDGNGATLSSNEAKTCTISEVYNKNSQGTTCVVDAPTITRNGYTVIGYNTSSNGITNNNSYNASTGKLTLSVSEDTGNGRTWYAITKVNRYKIIFDNMDDSLIDSSELYAEYNSNRIYKTLDSNELGTIPLVEKNSYTFIGWYTYTDIKVIDVDGTLISNVSGYTNEIGNWIINADITLYAKFEKNDEPIEDMFEIIDKDKYDVSEDIFKQVLPGMDSEMLFNTINTNGILSIIDKDDNILTDSIKLRTGYRLRATFTTKVLEYKISVKGDVLGTGELSINNAKEIARHVIDKNVIRGEEYLLAADYNNDEKIKMNDVMKILRDMKKQENP